MKKLNWRVKIWICIALFSGGAVFCLLTGIREMNNVRVYVGLFFGVIALILLCAEGSDYGA